MRYDAAHASRVGKLGEFGGNFRRNSEMAELWRQNGSDADRRCEDRKIANTAADQRSVSGNSLQTRPLALKVEGRLEINRKIHDMDPVRSNTRDASTRFLFSPVCGRDFR